MATKRKVKKKITLSEFKTWLAGVQSMQNEGWHPNKENWNMILEQIDNITETVVTKTKEVPVPAPVAHAPQHRHPDPTFDPRNPAYAAQAPQALPDTLINLPPTPNLPIPNVAPPTPVGTPAGDNGAISLDIKDTDTGQYESSFAE